MNNKHFSFLTVFLLGLSLGASSVLVFDYSFNREITVNSSVPKPNVDISEGKTVVKNSNSFDPPRYNFIQANHHKIDYDYTGSSVKVNVDRVINLHGSSMRPTMFTGHTALARDYNGEQLSEGTIISTGNVTHRIEGDYTETSGYYWTRGDNNEGGEKVRPEQIESVVIGTLYTDRTE